ncbi:tyrosine-type recombinase/integrase [Pseudomonas solani]|uniref:tyrosine-type recombinase/integrase n=1 Tax=Pseudomonas solani TaxID=2731552 RepID=UPI003F4ACFEA
MTISLRSIKSKRGNIRLRTQHHSMVPSSIPRTVHPVATNILSALLDACEWVAKTNFRRSRDRCVVLLMADTGIRREELTWIRCEDVYAAVSNEGKLRIRTSKRKGNPYRQVPVPAETLNAVVEYIEVSREIQIRKIRRRYLAFEDQGWTFCSRAGTRLAPASVSQLFSDLRLGVGIGERVSAHMLRHRYITLQVMARLRTLNSGSSLGVEAITTVLSKVASLSGHSSLDSMWRYVDWAYEELEIERSDKMSNNEEALCVLDRLLKEAEVGTDTHLVESLMFVKAALIKSGEKTWELPSVVTHSLRDNANDI